MQALVDTHCHLDFPAFDEDREQVLTRAKKAGVEHIIVPAVARSRWAALGALCESDPVLHAAFGLHPLFFSEHTTTDIDALERVLSDGNAIAVGECGLDRYVDDGQRELQQSLFEQQLALAKQFDLPLIVHARKAVEDVINAIRRIGGLRGVVHSYSGSLEQAEQLLKLDFMIGLGGPVTWPGSHRLRRVAAGIPDQQLLLETDAPDQSDGDWRHQRNEPARLGFILQEISALREIDADHLAEQTTANAKRLFGLG